MLPAKYLRVFGDFNKVVHASRMPFLAKIKARAVSKVI